MGACVGYGGLGRGGGVWSAATARSRVTVLICCPGGVAWDRLSHLLRPSCCLVVLCVNGRAALNQKLDDCQE